MKTPDEIKKGLECCTPRWIANHWKSCSSKCPYITLSAFCRGQLVYDALAYIQQLENHIGELTEKVSKLEAAQPKWISVEERLPEHGRYLVITRKGDSTSVHTATYNDMGWWIYAKFGEITHWMPLPEPPKEEA